MASLRPHSIEVNGRKVKFNEAREEDIIAFCRAEAHDKLMAGTRFASIIEDVVITTRLHAEASRK